MVGILPPRPLIARPPDRPPPVMSNGAQLGRALQQHSVLSASGQTPAAGSSAQGDASVCAAASSEAASVAAELGLPQQGSCPSVLAEGRHGQQPDQTAAATGSDAVPARDWANLLTVDGGSAVTHLLTQRFMPHRQVAAIRADGSIHVWREDGE